MQLNLWFAGSRTPDELTKQMTPVFFCSARLATLTSQHVGIRESPEIVGSRSRAESIHSNKNSYVQL